MALQQVRPLGSGKCAASCRFNSPTVAAVRGLAAALDPCHTFRLPACHVCVRDTRGVRAHDMTRCCPSCPLVFAYAPGTPRTRLLSTRSSPSYPPCLLLSNCALDPPPRNSLQALLVYGSLRLANQAAFCPRSSDCMKKRGWQPTGIAIWKALEAGFVSSAHLVQVGGQSVGGPVSSQQHAPGEARSQSVRTSISPLLGF